MATRRIPKNEKNKQYKQTHKQNKQYENLPSDKLVEFLYKRDCTISKIRGENKQLKQDNNTLGFKLKESNIKCKKLNEREKYFSNELCNVQSEKQLQSASDSDDSDSDYDDQCCIIASKTNVTNVKDIAFYRHISSKMQKILLLHKYLCKRVNFCVKEDS